MLGDKEPEKAQTRVRFVNQCARPRFHSRIGWTLPPPRPGKLPQVPPGIYRPGQAEAEAPYGL